MLPKLRPAFERMLACDHPLRVRQCEFRLGNFGLGEFCESRVELVDPLNGFRRSLRLNQVLRLLSVLLQARASRQLLCIHTNVLSSLCLESARIRLKECPFFRFSV